MRLEGLGLVGNCQCSALIDRTGAVVWSCLPRFDSEPVFGALLDPDGGRFSIGAPDGRAGVQRYLPNTNVLETSFRTEDGAFRVLDFAPRFGLYDRIFRPTKLVRIIDPLEGHPRVSVRCSPVLGWSKQPAKAEIGSHHLSFGGFADELRLTTDIPLSYVDGWPFALTRRQHCVLAWGEPVEEGLDALCDRFLSETCRYWERWVKRCSVPPVYQRQVIRSALVLKLHCFEDTGAIVAAMTTSIPEWPGTGRTWDYRYCWLRDAYYSLEAFRLLGQFDERERFIEFLANVAGAAPDLNLSPLYRVDGRRDLDEQTLPHWRGYEGEGPVRVGNDAHRQVQSDVFGEMVLALAPVFVDERFRGDRNPAGWDLLMRLARKAVAVAGQKDAGIWEYRKEWVPQTFSSMMCWAAADRAGRLALTHQPEVAAELLGAADRIRRNILEQAWSKERGGIVGTFGGSDFDAAILQAAPLRFLLPTDPKLGATIAAIRSDLDHNGWLRRYRASDGIGSTDVAFLLCTFWLVEALAITGKESEAREIMDRVAGVVPALGLLSEDWDPIEGRLWGNYPQAYSHVGLIHGAFAASPRWSEVV